MNTSIEKSIRIHSSLPSVWEHLTKPSLMAQWTGEPELEVEIITDWRVGNSFVIKGFHHEKFENRGEVMQFEPYRIIQYNSLSSISGLPDKLESYSITTFLLAANNGQTELTLRVENFPTETIYKHLDFYWQGTLAIIKSLIEKQ